MNKKILILGGGVCGCSLSYFLHKKGYEIDLIEMKGKNVGGLGRTHYYAGHPYEFGPHIWFWPDPSPINDVIRELTNEELYYIDRLLYSVIKDDAAMYRYPIHFDDIERMPNKEECLKFLKKHRDENWKLKEDADIPIIGECTFSEYFNAVIGKPLFDKFMMNYSWKMWNIHPDELQTSMVWADRIKDNYEGNGRSKGKIGYDPIKFEDHTLGKGIPFQVYPKNGWNTVWEKMAENANIIKGKVHRISGGSAIGSWLSLEDEVDGSLRLFRLDDYYKVINTLDIDELIDPDGEPLPYSGRIMIPLLIPTEFSHDHEERSTFPNSAESLHFSGPEFQTRVTDMSTITKYTKGGRLILIEVPITSDINDEAFPENTTKYAKENNLYARKAYAQQSEAGLSRYKDLLELSNHLYPNLIHCGRHAEFKYIGMPETVNIVYKLVEEQF